MIQNKVYTREEMREEHIITSDYKFIDKRGRILRKVDNASRGKPKYDATFSSAK